jgi:hypothetical protein
MKKSNLEDSPALFASSYLIPYLKSGECFHIRDGFKMRALTKGA